MSPEQWLEKIGMRVLPPPLNGEEAAEPPRFSDVDLALRFVDQHAHRLRFIAEWGKWLSWDGKYWRFDATLAAFDLARDLCQGEAAKCNKAHMRRTIASAKTVDAVVTLARANRRIAATVDQWDAESWLITTPDGIVDLRAGQVRPPRQEDYMTKMTATGPRGNCPLFLAFLDRIMGGDEALIAYLRRVFGYCLTGDTSEQAIFFNHGGGQNGKTVLMSTVSGILADYCHSHAHRDVHREQERQASDRTGTAARRKARHRHRDGGRTALGGKPPQGIDRRRADRCTLHAQRLLRIPADLQARHLRQPQAALTQRRRRDASAGQHDPVHGDDPAR